jgi:hypothetical protein
VIPADTFNQAFAYDHLLPVKYFYLGTFYVPPRHKPNGKRQNIKNVGKPGKKAVKAQQGKPQVKKQLPQQKKEQQKPVQKQQQVKKAAK